MPRTNLDKFSKPKRPVDYPKALILGRMAAAGATNDAMAAALGVSRSTWFQRRRQPSTAWTVGELLAACVYLQIEPDELRAAIRYRV